LTADLDCKIYVSSAAMIGQELQAEAVHRGKLGVKFLARWYSPHVWFGFKDSCCDIVRQLSKLHVSIALPPHVTAIQKMAEKARSYVLSDRATPIIGPFCHKFLELSHLTLAEDDTKLMRSWNARYDSEAQYPNDHDQWMFEYLQTVLPEFEYKKFSAWLLDCKCPEDMLRAPLFMEPKAPAVPGRPVVVDGEVLPADAPIRPDPPRPKPAVRMQDRKDDGKQQRDAKTGKFDWDKKVHPTFKAYVTHMQRVWQGDKPPRWVRETMSFAEYEELCRALGLWTDRPKEQPGKLAPGAKVWKRRS
jgi:hypothetical protein